MVLPLLVTPFVTMMFWSLGGGRAVAAKSETPSTPGLNLSLPDAHFGPRETWDKLTLYEIAQRDSSKFEQARANDPYFDLITFKTRQDSTLSADSSADNLINAFPHRDRTVDDPNEQRVNKKLEELMREINKPTSGIPDAEAAIPNEKAQTGEHAVPTQFTTDVDRLEQMMEMMNDSPETDPEMDQIGDVLEKILDIQHPDRVKEKLQAFNNQKKANALAVETSKVSDNVSWFGDHEPRIPVVLDTSSFLQLLSGQSPANSFYGLDDDEPVDEWAANAIRAVIHDTQELVDGATVKLRLAEDVIIKGKTIARGQFFFGYCAINGERLTIEVNSIRDGNSLVPVALSVYDLDGMEGIYIPGAITRDAAKQASGDALQNVQLMSLNPSIGAQAAAAGVEAAKGLLGKKARLIKVTVKAGYHVLLKDTKTTTH